MIDGVLALAVHTELIPRARRGLPLPRAFIARIAPEPRGFGLLCLCFGLQLYRRVISKERRTCTDQLADMTGQWFQQRRGAAHPTGQRGTMQIDLFASIDC
jgi:hypothetical protein